MQNLEDDSVDPSYERWLDEEDPFTPSHHLRIFLCHASKDKPAVRILYKRLCDDGFEAWLDEENLLPGQDWRHEISEAVQKSDIVIVCLSHGSVNKEGYIQKEIKLALDVYDEKPEGTIFLIPVRLEECDVPDRLSHLHWDNLFQPNGYELLMRALQSRAADIAEKESLTQKLPAKSVVGVRKPSEVRSAHRTIRLLKIIITRTGNAYVDAEHIGEIHELVRSFPGKDRFCFIVMSHGSALQLDFPNETTDLNNEELIKQLKMSSGVASIQISLSQ